MCHPPRLGLALLTTYVALATALIDGTGTLNLEYLPIDLSNQRPPQPRIHNMIHPRLEDLMETNDRHGGFPDRPSSAELGSREIDNTPNQHTEDLEELALAFLADKLRGTVEDGRRPQRRTTLQDKDFEELMNGMIQAGESDMKSRLTRQAFDFRKPRDQLEITKQLGEQGMHLVNCRSGRLDWPPCALFNSADTGLEHETKQDIPNEEEFVVVGSEEDGEDQPLATRRKREVEVAEGNEISRSARQVSQSHVLPSKTRKGFSAWGGKRVVPPFGSWGGKRAPDFHSWGGKRAQGGLKSHKKQMSNPSAWEGKRVPAFHSWGGKRATTFNSWGGKRAPSFNSWGGKRAPSFNSWGGKRAPSFNSWGGKRAPSFNSWGGKRAPSFNSWGGKRAPSFSSWGGKRAPSFNSWGGKRSLEFDSLEDNTVPAFIDWIGKRAPFNSWGGKRSLEFDSLEDNTIPAFIDSVGKRAPFNSWGGKRAPFNSWGGKRAFEDLDENSEDRLGQALVISADDSQLSKVSELENGELHSVSDGHSSGPWGGKWSLTSPHFDKQRALELVTQNKPPEKY